MHPPLAQSGLHQSSRPVARIRLVPPRVQHPQRECTRRRPSITRLGIPRVQSPARGAAQRDGDRRVVSMRVCVLSGDERVQVYLARQRKGLGGLGAVHQYRSDDQGHSKVDGIKDPGGFFFFFVFMPSFVPIHVCTLSHLVVVVVGSVPSSPSLCGGTLFFPCLLFCLLPSTPKRIFSSSFFPPFMRYNPAFHLILDTMFRRAQG